MKTTIQIPVDKKFKDEAQDFAQMLGYSSLPEYIRVSLRREIDKRRILFGGNEPEYINPVQEAALNKMLKESDKNIKNGDYIKSSNINELMSYLNNG